MTLLELARIAGRYETAMAHAMLHACAIAQLYGCEHFAVPGHDGAGR